MDALKLPPSQFDFPRNASRDNPFYQFAIALLEQFITYNLIGQPTEDQISDVKKLAHDIAVNIFSQVNSNVDNFVIELTKYILSFRYAQEAGFTSFLYALRDKRFYDNTQETSRLVGVAVNQALYKRFGTDLFNKALRYIQIQLNNKSINPRDYPTNNEESFPTPSGVDRTPEGDLGFVSNEQKRIEQFREKQAAEKKKEKEDLETEAEKYKQGQEEARRNQEKVLNMNMMRQKKPEKKERKQFFDSNNDPISKLQRAGGLGEIFNKNQLFKSVEDKAAERRDKQDEKEKSKFFVGQKIYVYYHQDKKFHPASVLEVTTDGLVVKYEENQNEALLEWRKILNENYNMIKFNVQETQKVLSTKDAMMKGRGLSPVLSTKDAMMTGRGLSPSNCSSKCDTCDTCSMIIEKKPFQSFKKKNKGKKHEHMYLMFCSIGCMQKKKF